MKSNLNDHQKFQSFMKKQGISEVYNSVPSWRIHGILVTLWTVQIPCSGWSAGRFKDRDRIKIYFDQGKRTEALLAYAESTRERILQLIQNGY